MTTRARKRRDDGRERIVERLMSMTHQDVDTFLEEARWLERCYRRQMTKASLNETARRIAALLADEPSSRGRQK